MQLKCVSKAINNKKTMEIVHFGCNMIFLTGKTYRIFPKQQKKCAKKTIEMNIHQ